MYTRGIFRKVPQQGKLKKKINYHRLGGGAFQVHRFVQGLGGQLRGMQDSNILHIMLTINTTTGSHQNRGVD
jgi:hypothetical protein